MKIKNSVILITGGASGIGENMAKYFSEAGGIVYICDVQKEKGNKIESESKGKIKYFDCDVSEESQVKEMIDKIYEENKRIDVVINNAGISGAPEFMEKEVSEVLKNYEKIYKINLLGAFLVSKYSVEKMIKNFDKTKDCNGVIIHISSIMGLQGMKGVTSYSASKGALIGMTLPMARDLGKFKIRVNSVCPGLIQTPLAQDLKASFKSIINSTPIKRLGWPFEVSQACEAIVINDFINGTVIKVDGGIIAHY